MREDKDILGFILSASQLLNQIKTNNVFVENVATLKAEHQFVALWDTGATETGITNRVVQMLNLKVVNTQMHKTAGDPQKVNLYRADVFITNRIRFQNVLVHELNGDDKDFDVLIGMDIIAKGTFCISNFERKTIFSFKLPVQE